MACAMAELKSPLHILLVEDDDDHAELAMIHLKRNNRVELVDRAVNAAEAVAYLRKQPPFDSAPRPDLVLLDLNLPDQTGHEILADVKADVSLRSIPIVVFTTSVADTDRDLAYLNYANSYIEKPSGYDEYKQLVDDLTAYWGVWNRRSQ